MSLDKRLLEILVCPVTKVPVQRMLDAHDPYPGVVIDRQWNVVLSNLGAAGLLDGIPAELLSPTINVFRLCLHPDGLARRTDNLGEWAAYLGRTGQTLTGMPNGLP